MPDEQLTTKPTKGARSGLYYLGNQENDQMTHYNPYVQNLIEMGYDEQDCRNVAAVGESNVTYPRNIHGRIFETETEYNDAVADFINGL